MDRSETINSSVERLESALAAIRRWNPGLNAMITVDEEGARRAAQAADRAAAMGRTTGLLHGVPMVVKDNIDTAGLRTTAGSKFFAERIPTVDADVVRRLRASGAVIVAKATLHEFAYDIRSVNGLTGQCRNPWDPSRIPGGSSGGSAVALGTGMAQMALGTDTGASIRVPAALCGVTGLRPTMGRISNRGSIPLSPTHDTIGPMATTVEDAALLFSVIAGYDAEDPYSQSDPLINFLPRLHDGVSGIRIGRPRNHYFDHASDAVGAAVEEALGVLSRLGAQIVEIELPGAEEIPHWYPVILMSDARDIHRDRMKEGDSLSWDPQTWDRLQAGANISGADYAHAMRQRECWSVTLTKAFENIDLIAYPTTPIVAPPIDDPSSLREATRRLSLNTVGGSFGRLPGLSVPCGFSPEGLPIGLLIEGPWRSEALLLQAGAAYQAATDWHLRRPKPIV
jgi:aspartyl-tRNA(Asn)/glutamyl-tRNA(Gln) amidotransferase subunit A